MTKFQRKFLLLLGLVWLPFLSSDVFACSCTSYPTPYRAFQESDTVFIGKVAGVSDSSGNELSRGKFTEIRNAVMTERQNYDLIFRFETQEILKGANAPQVDIPTSLNMCQFGFELGETYLVYAYKRDDGSFRTSIFCWRTTELTEAQDDLYFLRGLLEKRPEPRIYGSVKKEEKDAATDNYRVTYLEGIKVIAQRGKKIYTTVTDKNGLFSFDKLPNGTYKVYPKLTAEMSYSIFPVQQFDLTARDESFRNTYQIYSGRNGYTEFTIRSKK